MTNQELKKEHWDKIKGKFSHLENYCTIELQDIETDSIYYHPIFTIEDGVYIKGQCDVGNNYIHKFPYGNTFTSEKDNIYSIPIYEDLVENVIVSWKLNREVVLLAFDTLYKVNNHMEKMRSYTQKYVNNLLIGESINDLSISFINEIRTTTQIISMLQSKNFKRCQEDTPHRDTTDIVI